MQKPAISRYGDGLLPSNKQVETFAVLLSHSATVIPYWSDQTVILEKNAREW